MSTSPSPAAGLEGLLSFYAEAGVDWLVEATPIDRFAEAPPHKPAAPASAAPRAQAESRATPSPASGPEPTPRPAAQRSTLQMAVPDETALLDARAAAAEAGTLDELRAALDAFTGCNLRLSARNTVFADGNPHAEVMFVGEAPGRDEDIQGLPFVGRAGQMLDRMLAAIGRDRSRAYITNMIPWRPPGNRNPTPHEIELCRPFVERHIVLAAPKIVVFLGNVSNKALMNTNRGILAMRGTWGEYSLGEHTVPALPTLHPAYLLRNPAHKQLAWQDFLSLKLRLDGL